MAEGLFTFEESIRQFNLNADCIDSVLRIYPPRLLHYEESPVERGIESELDEKGNEILRVYFTKETLRQAENPELLCRLFYKEGLTHYLHGGDFPVTLPLKTCGSCVVLRGGTQILSSAHLFTAFLEKAQFPFEISSKLADRDDKTLFETLRVQNSLSYLKGDLVLFESNRPGDFSGLELFDQEITIGMECYLAGYPMATCRSQKALERHGYQNANGSLRISKGRVLKTDSQTITTDHDAGPGNSGSPLLSPCGRILGIYRGGAGNNLKEYTGVERYFTPFWRIGGLLY